MTNRWKGIPLTIAAVLFIAATLNFYLELGLLGGYGKEVLVFLMIAILLSLPLGPRKPSGE